MFALNTTPLLGSRLKGLAVITLFLFLYSLTLAIHLWAILIFYSSFLARLNC